MKFRRKILSLAMILALMLVSFVPAYASVNDTGFADVDADAWYAGAVTYCRDHDLMGGTGGSQFSPDATMSRAMLATVLWRLEGSPVVNYLMSFSDVENGLWYTEAIRWAASEQLMSGYGNGLFGTYDPVTREQFATVLWRYAGSSPTETGAGFADESSISSYAVQAVDWVRANGIMGGVGDNRFNPKGPATRAQAAMILMNYDLLQQGEGAETPEPGSSVRILVAYFSGTGTTKSVAQNIAAALGTETAFLYEITPQEPYTAADLDYTNSNCRAVQEQHDPNARPAISGNVEDMEQYDIVFLGYPIWNNDAPRIIYTFLESGEFSGKTIVPFCTSGGSGISNSVANIRGLASDATWLDGRRCTSSDTTSTLASWIEGLDLNIATGASHQPTEPTAETRVLVAYFSATNNTEGVAQHIADSLNANLYEIVPEVPYTSADLNYSNSSSRATVEQNDVSARPAISGSVENMEDYDIVFIGYPIWWGQAPKIIYTFLESYDFSGKTIVPFCTSGSSGIGSSATNLHSLTDNATWLSGQWFSADASRSTVVSWINGLDLDITAE